MSERTSWPPVVSSTLDPLWTRLFPLADQIMVFSGILSGHIASKKFIAKIGWNPKANSPDGEFQEELSSRAVR